jgi:serine/threonine protein kinase
MIQPPEPDPLVGQVLPGGLVVLERLGGTSEEPLYRAQYSPTGPPVALMLLGGRRNRWHPSAVSSQPARLWQQLRRACQIRHPNVASLLELGETPEGSVFAASELLTGQLLSEVLSNRGPLPLAEALDVCLQAAAGLQAAHRMGVAHGGLSPHTILITPAEDDRQLVKLIGFDFSWYEADSWRSLGRSASAQYSSPERLAGSAPDELSDVYSLGAVLHHLLVGTPPGEGSAPDSTPQGLLLVVDRALASPDRRYPTVAAFAEAISQAARAPSKQMRAKHRRSGWVAASIVSVFVAACLWLGWNRFRANPVGTPHPRELGAGTRESVVVSPPRSTSADSRQTTLGSVLSRIFSPQPVETGVVAKSKVADSTLRKSSPNSGRGDSGAGPFISPFRRSHPWAAHPGGRTYFPSSCPLALASSDLVYFANEREARATGRTRSTAPGCS